MPGCDRIHGFLFKKSTSFHDRLALEMNKCLQRAHVPEWMTKGKTTLIQKDPSKGTDTNNYRPITCLPIMWKIITAQIREETLRKYTAGYKLSRLQEKINPLMFMDDNRLFSKNEKELETLIHAVRIYSRYIGMEFGIEKCAMLVMKSGKRHLTDRMELPSQDKIRTLTENKTYKYLGILKADTIKQMGMKNKIQKEYFRRTRKLLETKLSS